MVKFGKRFTNLKINSFCNQFQPKKPILFNLDRIRDVFVASRKIKTLTLMNHKKVTSTKIFSEPAFQRQFLLQNVPSLMALVDSVQKQTAKKLVNHAEISMIMCIIKN